MRASLLARLLTFAIGSVTVQAHAALAPTIEFTAGPLATVPITSGSVSALGLTVTGAPLIGGPGQSILRLGGTYTLNFFNPVTVSVTEFNLTGLGALDNFTAAISGTLPASSNISWAAYVDPTNTPFGTANLIGSGNFGNPSPSVTIGFNDSLASVGTLNGPFSLTELLTISGPFGETTSFNSSITASSVPEPATLAILGAGFLSLGLVSSRRRSTSRPEAMPVEHY